jgi:hypothetical protein
VRLATAIRWSNGNVTCFDEHGQQIPALQGRYADVRGKVLEHATRETCFKYGDWNRRALDDVPRAEW